MRRISRAPAIPANEQLVPGAQTFFDRISGLFKLHVEIDQRLQSLGCVRNRFLKLRKTRHGVGACLDWMAVDTAFLRLKQNE